MTVSQISVFAESKPGHLVRVLRLFESAEVNVRGYAVSDTGEYGIARFVVDRPDDATAVLQQAGSAFTKSQVLCIKLEDRPGELARIMGVLAECGVNVSYSYSLISTYIVLNTADVDGAERILEGEPVELVGQDEISSVSFV